MYWFQLLKLGPYIIVITIVYFAYQRYAHLVDENAVLSENNLKLTSAIESERNALKASQEAIEAHKNVIYGFEEDIETLQGEIERAGKQKRDINAIFAKHDFAMLAYKKPGLVADRVNAATDELFSTFEDATSRDSTSAD